MKYKVVRIEAAHESWCIHVESIAQERENVETKPNDLGYYIFPEKMPDQQAFEVLKSSMIERHKEEILKLQKSLKELRLLEF
jgi:hypothetical protein